MDRCNICDGNDVCVGCDNVPWSEAPCTVFQIPTSGTTVAWLGMNIKRSFLILKMEITGSIPDPSILPDPALHFLDVTLERLDEVDDTNAIVQTFFLNNVSWFISNTQVQHSFDNSKATNKRF